MTSEPHTVDTDTLPHFPPDQELHRAEDTSQVTQTAVIFKLSKWIAYLFSRWLGRRTVQCTQSILSEHPLPSTDQPELTTVRSELLQSQLF